METIVELLPIPIYHKSNAFVIPDHIVSKMISEDITVMKKLDEVLGDDSNIIIDHFNYYYKHYSSEVLGIDPCIWLETVNTMLIKIAPGEPMYIHSHANCIVVAVYYINDAPESSPLVFFNETNVFKNFNFLLPYIKDTPYNKDVYKIYPKKGDIVVFPAWLNHFVPANESTTDRYSISSFAWLKGEIPSDVMTPWDRNFNRSGEVGYSSIYNPNLKFK